MKNILSKFFSGFTIFMMIMSFAGPMNVNAQTEDPITPAPEVSSTPSDEIVGETDEEIVEETPGTDTEPTAPEEEGEKKKETSELRVPLTIIEDVPQTATISATKILCPSEDLLPNWGAGGSDITASTASDFLSQNPSCESVDWNFEWSVGAPYVEDNILTGGAGWTTFPAGTTVVPAVQIGLREQMLPGYTTFTGQNTTENVSAELYCGSDVLNYDNLEYVNTVAGQTYHCVAFNAHPDVCGNIEEIQTEVPEGMETDGDYCYTPEGPQEAGICEEGDEIYESVYVSDEDTMVGANPAEILTFIHGAWTNITDASWIWSTDPVVLVPAVDEVETFTKTFEVTGTPTSASLTVAADNSYSVMLNGVTPLTCDGSGILNFSSADTCSIDVNDLIDGTNTLLFTVTNKNENGETAGTVKWMTETNPAGLIYKLSVNGDCATCDMQSGWDVDYYNYTQYDTGMNLPVQDWYKQSTYGNPLSANNSFVTTADAWTGWSYGMDKYEFSQVESDLMFAANNFFPFDSGVGAGYSNESLVFTGVGVNNVYTYVEGPTGTDYHFGLHATGYVTAPADGDYAFTLTSDDDVWVYVDGVLVVDNSGVHGVPGTVTGGNITLNEGVNKVELFYAERHGKQAALNFEFTNKDLVIMTTEDCLPPPPELCMDDSANNYNQPLPCTYDPEPTVGNIVIDKYECPADTSILRSQNGVGGTVPDECESQAGATFGIVYGVQTDANGPYPELDAVVTNLQTTNGEGVATFAELSPTGRYLVVETDALGNKLPHDAILGLFCEGDGDQSDNNDNQELTFVTAGETANCVAYNIAPAIAMCNPQENLILNGGFEDTALGANTWSIIPSSNPLLKWLATWVGIEESGTEGLEIQNNVAGLPYGGAQHAELDGDHPTTISQDIATVAGIAYDLNFAYSARPGVVAPDNDITVKIDGNVLGAVLSDDGTGDANTVWNTYTRSFVATDTTTTIEFTDTGADTSLGGYLDDVSLTCDPEPTQDMCPDVFGIQDSYDECYNSNDGEATINVIKHSIGGDGTFYFTDDQEESIELTTIDGWSGTGTFTVYPDSEGSSYDITEYNIGEGWNFTSAVCEYDGNEAGQNIEYGKTVYLDPGDEVTCTFTNTMMPMYIVDMCSNIDGNQSQVPDGYTLEGDNICIAPEETPNRSSSSGSRVNRGGGSVLGASTDGMCAWDASFMRRGWNGNKADDVKTVQNFLNQYMTSGLLVDGIFGLNTEAAVKAFQAKYADDVLKPWGINAPTGLFYLSTLTKAKEITCANDVTLPTLINWSENPTVR